MMKHDMKHGATLPVSVLLVIVYSLLVIREGSMVLPSGGPLVDTLSVIVSLRSPTIAASLLDSSLLLVTPLFWNLTELLKESEPWSIFLLDLLSGLLLLVVTEMSRSRRCRNCPWVRGVYD
jgi:hypothetical protein